MWVLASKTSDILRFNEKEEATEIMKLLSRENIKVTLRYVKG